MIMSCTRWFLFLICFVWISSLKAQDNLTAFWQPQAAINYNVSNTYSHNFSLAHRAYLIENENFGYDARQIDIVHFSKFNLTDNQSLAFGVQYRFRNVFEDEGDEVRLTQQFNFTKRPLVVRFGHRFRTEQRITKALTIHRFRYRFAVDFPLKGEKLNIGEPYFVGGFENLLSVAKSNLPQYDTRISCQLGWRIQDGLKIQTGIEYRVEDYTSTFPQNVFFLLTSVQLIL